MCHAFIERSPLSYMPALADFVSENFATNFPHITARMTEFICDNSTGKSNYKTNFYTGLFRDAAALCLVEAKTDREFVSPNGWPLSSATSYNHFIGNVEEYENRIPKLMAKSQTQAAIKFKEHFPCWESVLDFDNYFISQDIFISKVKSLTELLPESDISSDLKTILKNIPGLCRGFSILFNLYCIGGQMANFFAIVHEICTWNETRESVSSTQLKSWLNFVEKLCKYQSLPNITKQHQTFKKGSKIGKHMVADCKSVFGYFPPWTLLSFVGEENPIFADTLESGMILLTAFTAEEGSHSLTIRKEQGIWYIYDANNVDGLEYCYDSNALAQALFGLSTAYGHLGFTFVSFKNALNPDETLLKIANAPELLEGRGLVDTFTEYNIAPITSLEKILHPDNYSWLIDRLSEQHPLKGGSTPLHAIADRKEAPLLLPLAKYDPAKFGKALSVQCEKGYTPFMILTLSNFKYIEDLINLLSTDLLMQNLAAKNEDDQSLLHYFSWYAPEVIVILFEKLKDYRSDLINAFKEPDRKGFIPASNFQKKASPGAIEHLNQIAELNLQPQA